MSEEGTIAPAVAVEGLTIRAGELVLVSDVSFAVGAGERVGIIGESGSGKSLTALAAMGLLPDGLTATGSVRVAGVERDVLELPERELARLRGARMSMVFQEPMTALNPLQRVGRQVAETLRLHGSGGDVGERAVELLERVRLPDPRASAAAYPHQLSGGQRQRVMLAIALANDPALLICDEPTTALDVTVQAQMLDLIRSGVADRGAALVFITHDLAVVAEVCDRVLVLYGGRIVEAGPIWDVFTRPRHRYTKGLLDASDLAGAAPAASGGGGGRLPVIRGSVPAAGRFPEGCVFRTRCDHATEACETLPGWRGDRHRGHACEHPVGVPA